MSNNVKKGAGESSRSKKKEMSVLSKSYLMLYNGVQCTGWSYVLIQTFKLLLVKKDISGLWDTCGTSLVVFQSLAFAEVVHSAVGLVPSSAIVTFVQIFSRLFQVWGILIPIKETQNSPALALTLIAWGLTESIRYSYYLLNIVGLAPKFLTWCRYTFFIGLYPAGVLGESGNVLYGLNTLKQGKLFSIALPNRLNVSFNFYYATIIFMLSYIPIFPKLYLHMFHQRKKVLSESSSTTPKKLK